MKNLIMLMVCVILAGVAGCVTSTDPTTGQQQVSVDPNVVEQAEAGAVAVAGILALLIPFFPWAFPALTALAGVIATWRKMKPKIVNAQSETEMYHSIASSVVLGIEEYKKLYPEKWEDLAEELEALKNKIISPEDRLKIENVIRGLRGLMPTD